MEKFLTKNSIIITVLFIIGWIIPRHIFSIESNSHLLFSFKYMSIPTLLICFYLYYCKLPKYRKRMGRFKGFTSIIFISLIIVVMSANYLTLINAYIGNQQQIVLEGEIVGLDSKKLRLSAFSALLHFTNYHVFIKDSKSNEVVKLEVSEDHFLNLKTGQLYSENWTKGFLNLIYRDQK